MNDLLGTAICAFLAGFALAAGCLARSGNPRAEQLQADLDDANKRLNEMAAVHADECHRFRCTAERFIADRESWRIEKIQRGVLN